MQTILKFQGKWRDYQARVLNELSFHIADKKLNIVAAPGAGKTTLGIEVIARLNAPALILAPTLTIRNQWIERITKAFLTVPPNDVISTNIRDPKQLTVITYQALLAAFCKSQESECDPQAEEESEEIPEKNLFSRFNKDEADKIIAGLKKAKTDILCFDEAHHLRKEWWKALDYLTANLQVNHAVSLTATPPYDVSYSEWQRYEDLCGPIDALISIPELVKNGDLCPHQDFIHFSKLRDNEARQIDMFKQSAKAFLSAFAGNRILAEKLSQTEFFTAPEKHIEEILDDPEFFAGTASYINTCGFEVPKPFLKIFDIKHSGIPFFNADWAQKVLNGLFYTQRAKIPEIEEDIKKAESAAKSAGIIFNKKIALKNNPKIAKALANSLSKLDSIADIVGEEELSLGKDLRMVILADFIRAESFGQQVSTLGVVPIFETLRNIRGLNLNLGVLTGKVVVIPLSIKDAFTALAKENYGLDEKFFRMSPLEADLSYIKIVPSEQTKNIIVSLITELFNRGELNVLTGTQALLGEGWDAPSINSLILSSTVSSYMLSNQMRGRAIRINKNDPDKVSNIWHLVSVKQLKFNDFLTTLAPGTKTDEEEREETDFTYDFYKVSQRFNCFEAPSYKTPYSIQSGIERLGINTDKVLSEDIWDCNKNSLQLACDRNLTRESWDLAFHDAYSASNIEQGLEIKNSKNRKNTLIFNATLKYTVLFYAFLALGIFSQTAELGLPAFVIILGIFTAFMARPFYKYFRSGSVEGTLRQVTICVLESLYAADMIKSNLKTIGISVKEMAYGVHFFSISNVTPEENNLILKAVREVLEPVENPRYIIERHGLLFERFRTIDHHAVPEVIGKKKNTAEVFEKLWHKYVASGKLIYTRTIEGRKLLLKARKKTFSSQFRKNKFKKLSMWS